MKKIVSLATRLKQDPHYKHRHPKEGVGQMGQVP